MTTRTLFVGRERELAELEALAREKLPLVTLWGPGGVGKTTLARRCVEGREDVVWLDLSACRSEADLVATLAAVLGVTLDGSDDARGVLVRSASARRAMLVADNAEQLDRGARDLLGALAGNGTRVLATSRDPLGVELETLVALDPLPAEAALRLFVDLSGAPADERAREIVRRLSALPLAIELAAARVPLLGTDFLLERLDRKLDFLCSTESPERHARHATLRATIGWSWDLLEPSEQTALFACATFEGAFDVALALRVIGDDEGRGVDTIERLHRKALVVVRADREGPELHMLEAIRDFVRGQLAEKGPDVERDWYERHALAIVERSEPLARVVRRGGAAPAALLKRRADLFAASGSSTRVGATLVARATVALAALVAVTGPFEPVIERAARVRENVTDAGIELRLAIVEGDALRAVGRHAEAEDVAKRALVRAEAATDELAHADALRLSGAVARSRGDAARAIALLSDASARYERLGERALAAVCLGENGAAHLSDGQIQRAQCLHAEAIAVHVAEGSTRAEGIDRSYLAVAVHRSGDVASAVALHEAALAIHRRIGHRRLEGAELLHLGFVCHEAGRPGPARASFAEARRLLAAAGARGLEALALVFGARLEADEGNAADARVLLAEAVQRTPRGWPRLDATRLLVSAHVMMTAGDPTGAASAYEAAWAASRDVEVGFEALTPAYLALARVRSEKGAPSSISKLTEEARGLVARVANPHVAAAFSVLEAAIGGRSALAVGGAQASSSEVRRALAFAGTVKALGLAADGRRVLLPDGREVDLSRRKNVRLVLVALARTRHERPGVPIDAEALVEAGWPGERMRPDAALGRLHTAIWTLRSIGLERLIVSSEAGYLLDPAVPLHWV